jgi:hypothetical protein
LLLIYLFQIVSAVDVVAERRRRRRRRRRRYRSEDAYHNFIDSHTLEICIQKRQGIKHKGLTGQKCVEFCF